MLTDVFGKPEVFGVVFGPPPEEPREKEVRVRGTILVEIQVDEWVTVPLDADIRKIKQEAIEQTRHEGFLYSSSLQVEDSEGIELRQRQRQERAAPRRMERRRADSEHPIMRYLTGDIWKSEQEHIVIPVNCKGVAGAGLALQWKQRNPGAVATYMTTPLRPGGFGIYDRVIALATKDDWRKPARIEWVEIGLLRLALSLQDGTFASLAMPMIGCGLGGLNWQAQVWPLVREVLETYDVDVYGV